MKKPVVVLLAFTVILSLGCASVIKGTEQLLTFTSEPAGAEVFVDGRVIGVTPLSIKLKKSKYSLVMVKKAGYKTQTMPIEKKFDSTAILSIFWDLSTTDIITGAVNEYSPSLFHFELQAGDSWKFNNKKLDRDVKADWHSFVAREYYHIKQSPEGEEMETLLYFVSSSYGVSKAYARKLLTRGFGLTDTPPQLIDYIKRNF